MTLKNLGQVLAIFLKFLKSFVVCFQSPNQLLIVSEFLIEEADRFNYFLEIFEKFRILMASLDFLIIVHIEYIFGS